MILTVAELRHAGMTGGDDELEAKARAIEELVRAYTHNNFQNRGIRNIANVVGGKIVFPTTTHFKIGDTVEITNSRYNNGVYTITSYDGDTCVLSDVLIDEDKILYAVKNGVLGLLRWERDNADKRGIQSETISRHSVTYFNMDGENAVMGYPRSMMSFLKPYMKARF